MKEYLYKGKIVRVGIWGIGAKVCKARLSLNLRQVDVASLAKVSPCEVTALEKDRCVRDASKARMLAVLNIDTPDKPTPNK